MGILALVDARAREKLVERREASRQRTQ